MSNLSGSPVSGCLEGYATTDAQSFAWAVMPAMVVEGGLW